MSRTRKIRAAIHGTRKSKKKDLTLHGLLNRLVRVQLRTSKNELDIDKVMRSCCDEVDNIRKNAERVLGEHGATIKGMVSRVERLELVVENHAKNIEKIIKRPAPPCSSEARCDTIDRRITQLREQIELLRKECMVSKNGGRELKSNLAKRIIAECVTELSQ